MNKCYCTETVLNNNARPNHIRKISGEDWLRILKTHNYQCTYCGVEFTPNNIPVKDHIIPRSKGGTNLKDNITCACNKCNMEKGNKYHRRNGELWVKNNNLINEAFCF